MTSPTKLDLSDSTLELLTDLVQANVDSANGFEEASQAVSDEYYCTAFRGIADQHRRLSRQLEYYVVVNGQRVHPEESWLSALQRSWVDLCAKLNGGDPSYLATEMAKLEDQVAAAYQDVTDQSQNSPITDIIAQHLVTIHDVKQRIEQLRQRAED